MQFTIERTDIGWRILDGSGEEVASFTGAEEAAYQDAVAHMGSLVQRGLVSADDASTPDGEAGLLPERWVDVDGIAFSEALPGGRDFTQCAWSSRDPNTCVLPLMLQTQNDGGHAGASLAGFIDALSIDDGTVHAAGRFYANDAGTSARDLLLDGRKFGVSVDPSEAVSASVECSEMDEFGWCLEEQMIFTEYEIAGLTMVPFPGFENAAIKLAASNRIMFIHNEAAIKLATGDNAPADNSGGGTSGSKSPQDAVSYETGGEAGKQCQDCAHYQDGSPPHCQIVEDPISATGTCTKFTALNVQENASIEDNVRDLAKYSADDLRKMVGKGQAMGPKDSPSYPIADCEDASNAVHAVSRGSGDHDAIRRHIIKNANKLSCDVIPENWNSDGSTAAIAASITIPSSPPRGWFELPEPELNMPFLDDAIGNDVLVEQRRPVYDGRGKVVGFGDEILGMACPFTITDSGMVYGHLTYWGQCHIGNPWGPGKCAAPSPSESNYDDFYGSGYVVCDDGSELRCGVLHVGCQHSTAMDVRGVHDAAAHAGLAFAQVRVVDGVHGPWLSGALLPTVTDEQVVKLRSLTLSGEWAPELGAVIAVNDGGLPIQRVDRIAASSGAVFPVADRVLRASISRGAQTKLVGGNAIYRCPECQKRAAAARAAGAKPSWAATFEEQLDRVIATLDMIESRTRHQTAVEAESIRASLEDRKREK